MFIFYILIFSKHGHLIASYHPENITMEHEADLLSGLFSAMQISYKASYDNPLLSMPGRKNRLYFFPDNKNDLIYAINCAFISHMDIQIFLKKLRDIINTKFKIDGNNPCHIPNPILREIQEILSNETKQLEHHVKTKYFIPK
ncbi:MAG: hypothetical protein EU548_06730 [Promethearchaeota archaeon]|nr:MAG: hypothetical protein EU548_06730 [Candidatus Lokiarchaeota archaeon]